MNSMLLTGAALLLLSGCSQFRHGQDNVMHYQCGTMPLTVTQTQMQGHEQVAFFLDGERLRLRQVADGSGKRYSNDNYTFVRNGNRAAIQRDGKLIVDDCVLR
ncbi:MliC family protein [Lonsdalea populi]|uniref:MliC family protein n=1 Tax=Lonsdalea populi TaxID=1172565 RepID=UPI000A21E8F9|nr:MliC family protein [Lonsdalea populi]OSM99522.1 lysozyme inhibitor [Lonsdalea populi]RAT70300.1 lysozyme inhibitor [Lonsdalea populi]RAT73819.1 lysozyme inhibitor [Lonsdalea populi]RAT77935.1 lysozyme inhibitor [Lonsdalea populi]RAT79750.1 lysozyme inhibitor [Lonsdalea populi]